MQPSLSIIAPALAAVLLFGSFGSRAQGNPSSDMIIKSLQPTTRGIRPVAPMTPAAPEPASHNVAPASLPRAGSTAPRPAPAAPHEAEAAPSVNLTVQFRSNSAELTPAAAHTLDELGRALSSPALASFRFRIEGHTDTVGSPEANKALSERRAATVVDYLSTKFGVARTRLEPAGMGEDGLLVQTPPQVSEPRNRRVQVVNLGA